MDDFSVTSLIESRNEWSVRLLNILTPLVISGFNSIWKDAYTTATRHNEASKYLMTFQNYLSQIPKWSTAIVQAEVERIIDKSGCNYLEDLLSCVHIIQLKTLSCVRVGQRQKKVEIEIPSLASFIHNVYINCARKIYTNVYLFEADIPSLQVQKNNRELEMIIRECLMNTVRESVPTERILRAYMDETVEEDVETKEEIVQTPNDNDEEEKVSEQMKSLDKPTIEATDENKKATQDSGDGSTTKKENTVDSDIRGNELASALTVDTDLPEEPNSPSGIEQIETGNVTKISEQEMEDIEKPAALKFNDSDEAISVEGVKEVIDAPKTIDRLEHISEVNFAKRKEEEEEEEEDEKLNIGESVNLEFDDIISLGEPKF